MSVAGGSADKSEAADFFRSNTREEGPAGSSIS
jgi:hypothetical protein